MGEGWKTQLRLDWGDVPVDRFAEHMPVLKRAMFLPDGAPAVVAVAGAPAESKGAMFPVGQDWSDLRSECSFPNRPRVSHRLPTAAVFIWGIAPVDSPWKTLPAKPGAGSLVQPRALRFCCFRPLLQGRRVFLASSTAPVPDKPEARWAKGGKRNSASN